MKNTARIFKALADETRLRILALLLHEGELCVCDIMAALQLPQSTASRHLAYLKNAGWVEDRRMGVWMYYSVAAERGAIQKELAELLRQRLPELCTADEDLKRLVSFSHRSNCA
ncbi:ArsR/SmtB family transcription factor [Geotalea uraniireducens]|uniref:Transcriptional regulator, ArsR family n=1 Tax=Geotalea uraniireducens (strain Rf4) TaxID=351605 RepID=A5GCL2_GEOUR|nr:metalloregulator ArsR/SmtB family transcription factor [Geotalea uraniireducens]ABQ24684.1 transcriptional regulator, ArsR family [Geotalea uraniireducens Rf4]